MEYPYGCADSAFDDPEGPFTIEHQFPVEVPKGSSTILPVEKVKLVQQLQNLEIAPSSSSAEAGGSSFAPSWVCAICLENIQVEDAAQLRDCEHTYCANCILRWASFKEHPWCPQCKLPFYSLYVSKTLDGRPTDYMQEESVCLLLRASWFHPLQEAEEPVDDYQEEQDYDEEYYYTSNLRLGNRRWGDTGYVRAGRREARPISVRHVPVEEASGSSSRPASKGKEAVVKTGRRAKRAQKREAASNK